MVTGSRSFLFAVLFLIGSVVVLNSAAEAQVTLIPSQDTYISESFYNGGSGNTHGSDPAMVAIGAPTFLSYPLIQFDLTPYAGQIVEGSTATFSLYVSSGWGPPYPGLRPVSVYDVLTPWDASTTTYNNFGATPPGVSFGTDVGAALNTESVSYPPVGYASWTIPSSVVQQWIDDPSSNHGLLVNNDVTVDDWDIWFSSMETANPPLLTFSVSSAVPEPGTLALFATSGLGAFGLLTRKRRR